MKTLTSTIALIILTTGLTIAQNATLKTNEIAINLEVEDGMTTVFWSSNREVNTSYFIIEKSVNGKAYTALGTRAAGGSTHQAETYSFEDVASDSALAQYRVTLVCMDGSRYSVQTANFHTQGLAEVTIH